MSRVVEILAGICFGLGFANFVLFGIYINAGRIEWGYYALGIILLAIFTVYFTIQQSQKKVG